MYSLKKGFLKGVGVAITAIIAVVIVAGISDVTLTDLISQYLFPLIEGITAMGLLKMIHNWIKFKSKEA